MIDFTAVVSQALDHLREGQVQIADDLLMAALRTHAADQAAASGVKPPPPPPRSPNQVLLDILNRIVSLFGTPAPLETLVKELEQVL